MREEAILQGKVEMLIKQSEELVDTIEKLKLTLTNNVELNNDIRKSMISKLYDLANIHIKIISIQSDRIKLLRNEQTSKGAL